MNAVAKIEQSPGPSVLGAMADRYGMVPAAFEATVRATVCKGNVSREEFAAFLLVAKEHRLNPLTKEIYAFPAKGGGIQPIVSIDGWARIINEHPQCDGVEFTDLREGADLIAVECRIYRKDRTRPTSVTEYMTECRRSTDVWKQWPARMLRHKALIQCARYAFGFSGIVDPDEYERSFDPPARPAAVRRLHAGFDEPVEAIEAHVQEKTLNERLDGDDVPLFEQASEGHEAPPAEGDEGAAPDSDPPPQTPPQETAADPPKPSLRQRVEAFKGRVNEAKTTIKLKSIHAASADLRRDADMADPDLVAEMDAHFNTRFAAVEDEENERRKTEGRD